MNRKENQAERERIFAKWDSLTPRERDEWIASAIFGAEPVVNKHNGYVKWWIADSSEKYGVRRVPDSWTEQTPPSFTTDITHAWTLAEHNGYFGGVSYMGVEYRAEIWSRWGEEGAGVHEYASGDSAPEAICLAALLAKIIGGA